MPAVDRKLRLLEAIIGLRRAERRNAPDPDVTAARVLLEEDLGPTITRRLAARVLGVDHKSLERWVRSGDLPLVLTADGRREVPVESVIELYEAVTESRRSGRRRRHLEPVLSEGRRRAELLNPAELISDSAGDDDGHGRAERRSLAYHRALARRLTRAQADEALRRLWTWQRQGRIDPRYADEWQRVLQLPVRELRRVIGEDSQRGRDLRQNSPLAGLLSEPERDRINQEVR